QSNHTQLKTHIIARFSRPPDATAHRLTESLSFDVRLAPQDVEATVAHVRALEAAELLDAADAEALEHAVREVGEEIVSGTFNFDPSDEDVHSAIERGVTSRLGELGERLHAGRSRNDLVVTDLRLWSLAASARIQAELAQLLEVVRDRAREGIDVILPGTTHGRLAQPVTLGHHLMAHAFALLRDLERLEQWAERTRISPLGAGAIATSTLPLDPAATAKRLGLSGAFDNSMDAVSDRDFVMELLSVASILAMHLSRIAADLIRWSDESVRFARLDDAFATGSSMMPQKRNPDPLELVRAKAARPASAFARLAQVLDGLPLGYHRDLQEDKEPLFDAVDSVETSLPAIAGCLATVTFDADAMRAAAGAPELYATDVAEALVAQGVPFREAHRKIGGLLRLLEEEGRTLGDLSAEEWDVVGLPEGAQLLDAEHAVSARAMHGGPSHESVEAQLDTLERAIAARR
ncbi:MAG: argininosuccinate lyase, partial [Actinomycetota bacterium]